MLKVGDLVEIILCDKSIFLKKRLEGVVTEVTKVDKTFLEETVYKVKFSNLYFYEHELKLAKKNNKYKYIRSD